VQNSFGKSLSLTWSNHVATKSKFRILDATTKEATDIAQVLANKTSQKILNYVSTKSATETELVQKLKISASTVHYNIKQLKSCHLLVEDAMHYSPKGKEVIHYKATDEHIVISPKRSFGLAEKLQAFVPIIVLTLFAYALLSFLPGTVIDNTAVQIDATVESASADQMLKAAPMAVAYDEPVMEKDASSTALILLLGILLGSILSFVTLVAVYFFRGS